MKLHTAAAGLLTTFMGLGVQARAALLPVTGVVEIPLIPGQSSVIAPLLASPSLQAVVGDPNTLVPFLGDSVVYAGETWVVVDDGTQRVWQRQVDGATLARPLDAGAEPLVYQRSRQSSPVKLVWQGPARLQPLTVRVPPGGRAALFLPDGRAWPLASSSRAAGSSLYRLSATGLLAGDGVGNADVLTYQPNETVGVVELFFHATRKAFFTSAGTPLASSQWPFFAAPAAGSVVLQHPATALVDQEISLPGVASLQPTITEKLTGIDLDKDGMADAWERAFAGSGSNTSFSPLDPATDVDGDGGTQLQEYRLGSDPLVANAYPVPTAEVVPSGIGGVRQMWVSFPAVPGCRYRVEGRAATEAAWRVIGAAAHSLPPTQSSPGTLQVQDVKYRESTGRSVYYYRIVGLAPSDADRDALTDWEEVHVFHTRPDVADTDGDGTLDGAEARVPMLKNPLEYYDRRVVTVTPISPISQWAPAGEQMRESLAVKLTSGRTTLKNAPVRFVFAKGAGTLALSPISQASTADQTMVDVLTDATGVAHVWLKPAAGSTEPIQIVAAARVPNLPFLESPAVYATSLMVVPTNFVRVPADRLVAWFRADQGYSSSGGWASATGRTAGVVATAPQQILANRRAWLQFNGLQALDLQSAIAEDHFHCYFAAIPTANRTSTAASHTSAKAGVTGQRYLFAGEAPLNEPNMVKYSPPAKPAAYRFSLWEQLDFFLTDRFPQYVRPYVFTPASGRQDNTQGYRLSPSPTGSRSRKSVDSWVSSLAGKVKGLGNWNYTDRRLDSKSLVVQGRTAIREDFFEIAATSWKGNSSSASFGGVVGFDLANAGNTAAALSVGRNNLAGFELRNDWRPSVTPAAAGAVTGFLGAWLSNGRQQRIEIAGLLKSTGLASPAARLLGPRYLGGVPGSSQGFVGNVGDVLLFDQALSAADHAAVQYYLGTVYRGFLQVDADKDKVPDWWEMAAQGSLASPATEDGDGDGLNLLQEYLLATSPHLRDTDADGSDDREEYLLKRKPAVFDSDGDLIPDGADPLHNSAKNGLADVDGNGRTDAEDQLRASAAQWQLVDLNQNGTPDLLELFSTP